MQVIINNSETYTIPLSGKLNFGSNDDCDVCISELEQPYAFSIKLEKYACIIDVVGDKAIQLNRIQVKKQALLNPGDQLNIGNLELKVIDDNKLPRIATTPFKLNNETYDRKELLTSVTGLRSYNLENNGELSILDSNSNFTHKSDSDTPFAVSFVNNDLTLLCKKGEFLKINGNQSDCAVLKHGDFITTHKSKYCIESPGSSAYSKYSPSHPRNMQLSEEYLEENSYPTSSKNSFFKKHLWWISMLSGLIIIAILLILIKNITTT
jgi:hypothetical protein